LEEDKALFVGAVQHNQINGADDAHTIQCPSLPLFDLWRHDRVKLEELHRVMREHIMAVNESGTWSVLPSGDQDCQSSTIAAALFQMIGEYSKSIKLNGSCFIKEWIQILYRTNAEAATRFCSRRTATVSVYFGK
jgi:hypothetical protein